MYMLILFLLSLSWFSVSLFLLLLLLLLLLQIPEYCRSLDEQDVSENAFELIFAFDEIVALGYRENVNMAQVRTFTEMDSHEERVFEAMRKVGVVINHCVKSSPLPSPPTPTLPLQSQEREAKEEMKRKARELTIAKREAKKGRPGYSSGFAGGFGSSDVGRGGMIAPTADTQPYDLPKPSYSAPR